jgi:carbamoyltransferase
MHILGLSCYFPRRVGRDPARRPSRRRSRGGALLARQARLRIPRPRDPVLSREAGISGADLDYVAFFEKPFVKFDRILQTAFAEVPKSAAVFRQAITAWLLDKLWVKNRIREAVGIADDRILFAEHHQSHAASAFFCSPFDEAAILTVDGVGEWATATTGRGRDRTVTLTHEIHFPHSLGLLYSAFTAFLGFEVNEGEYKVMGMAPYGRPRFVEDVRKLINVERDGAFTLNLEYFAFQHSRTRTYSDAFVKLFGEPRPVETLFFTEASGFPPYFGDKPSNYDALAAANQRYADLAASIQAVTEETLLTLARGACERAGTTKLCMAGGVALNSVANGRILREAGVTDLFIQPAAGDSGAALGAALVRHHQISASRGVRHGARRVGQQHSMDAIRARRRRDRIPVEECRRRSRHARRAAATDSRQARCSAGTRDASSGARAPSATQHPRGFRGRAT